MEVDARLVPPALHSALGEVQQTRDFGEREAAEEFQVDHFGQAGIGFAQVVESFADLGQFAMVHQGGGAGEIDRGDLEPAAALLRPALARVIDN